MSNKCTNYYDNQFEISFGSLSDPRRSTKGNYVYPLIELLFLSISAILCGYQTNEDIEFFGEHEIDWLRKFFPYKNGVPSHDTIARLFQKLDPKQFNLCFVEWVSTLAEITNSQVVSVDGKSIKGSAKGKKNAIHIVSAFASENGLCLGQVTVDKKSNEITAIPELLDLIAIKGMIITTDAMGCQTKIAEKIIDNGGDYVLQVKGNQVKLLEELTILFNTDSQSDSDLMENKGHGRIETRFCDVISEFESIECLNSWKDLASLIQITSKNIDVKLNKESVETRYYISSLSVTAKRFNEIVRSHWSIENNLHWSLDVVFNEDKSQRKKDNSAINVNMLSKMALNMLKQNKDYKYSNPLKRKKADKDHTFRERLLGLTKSGYNDM